MSDKRGVEKLPLEDQNYKKEELTEELAKLILAFQIAFDKYIRSKLFPVACVTPSGVHELSVVSIDIVLFLHGLRPKHQKAFGSLLLVDPREISTWSLKKGALESACLAAEELVPSYDVGIGIAKKGLWLSFIFSLFDLPTFDLMVMRTGDSRVYCPMDPIFKETLEGKRILLFDNDAVTGKTIAAAAEAITSRCNIEFLDLLLISRYSHLSKEFYQQVKDQLAPTQFIGKSENGKYVVDTLLQIPSKLVRRKMTLEKDFKGQRQHLEKLKAKLGV